MWREVMVGRGGRAVAAGAVGVFTLSCIGGERAEREPVREEVGEERPVHPGSAIDYDTIPTVDYTVFETVTESESPRKITVRLMVLDRATPHSLTKTLRQAVDSLTGADSALVAARAILYTGHPAGPGELDLVPMAHAFWVPPEGWEAADRTASEQLHRTYVYFGVPDPGAENGESDGEAGSDD